MAALRAIAQAHLGAVADLVASHLERRVGLVTVIDVRPPEEYAQGHVAGTLNVPLDRLQERPKDLPPDRETVAYCCGPRCVLPFEAIARLREAEFDARRLQDGLPEWRQAGSPMLRDWSKHE